MLKFALLDSGSPPRMRGALPNVQDKPLQARITPAHAGSTGTNGLWLPQKEDHPRACGEHFSVANGQVGSLGSPPRMRGAPDVPGLNTANYGITPAHAGSTTLR